MSQNDAETPKSGVEDGTELVQPDDMTIPVEGKVYYTAIMPDAKLRLRILSADESIS